MIPYSNVGFRLIKPETLSIFSRQAEKNFLAWFENDEKSFSFLHALLLYVSERRNNEWPEILSVEMIAEICRRANCDILLEETVLYKYNYIIKNGTDFELTHELIVSMYLCFGGKNVPLSGGHIDATAKVKISTVLRGRIFGKQTKTIDFLLMLLEVLLKNQGVVIDQWVDVTIIAEVAVNLNLSPKECVDETIKFGLMQYDEQRARFNCNNLLYTAYYAAPRLKGE